MVPSTNKASYKVIIRGFAKKTSNRLLHRTDRRKRQFLCRFLPAVAVRAAGLLPDCYLTVDLIDIRSAREAVFHIFGRNGRDAP